MRRFENVVVLLADGVADSTGERVLITDVLLPDCPISVRLDFKLDQCVGRARLRKEATSVVADVELLDDVDARGLFPAIGGVYVSVSDSVPPDVRRYGVRVDHLGLCRERNADLRIEPLVDERVESQRREIVDQPPVGLRRVP